MGKANVQSGFTLLELFVTVGVGAILLAVAIPGLMEFVANNRAAAQANEIVGALRLARNVAVTRGAPVAVCSVSPADSKRCATGSSTPTWTQGWIAFVDATGAPGSIDAGDVVLRVYPALAGGSAMTGSAHFLRFRPEGFPDAGAATLALRVPKCTLANNRNIAVTAQGRVSVTHAAC